MKQIIKVAVIGGTGKSGKYLIKQLIRQGFHFKILLRNPKDHSFDNPLIEIVEGSVRDYNVVHALVKDCQAVISTLGQPKNESSIFSQATTNVIQAMHAWGVKRYILTTGLNVNTPFDKKSPATKFATEWMKENYPETTFDKQKEYEILSQSDVDWTLIRLPLIEQTDATNQIHVSIEDCPGNKISATDLARFLTEQLFDKTFIRKSPFIANL